jgi:hypothetical protein
MSELTQVLAEHEIGGPMSTKEALQAIVNHKDEPSLNWAVNYAQAGLTMSGEDLRVQCLYVVGNITRWRGPLAKRVREALKRGAKK